MVTKEQIEQEAVQRYIKGTAGYCGFILGAEYVLNNINNGNDTSSIHN